ncbi:hypothetical protein C2845_PM13G11170 [Panicum miliaceum]|uniref:Retrotransposon protein, putative, unclassified n=1 Tax=Panicum miliaceum TaxID=4540 RepID=A0A3L6RL68_PANMI|nr:hypothetical protein C2845_PM13G11170 [Panicum miliaceum]
MGNKKMVSKGEKKEKEAQAAKVDWTYSWKKLWFYIGNHKPTLRERTAGKAQQRPEWNENLSPRQMVQVHDLHVLILALNEMGVTGASVMYSILKRRIQQLQKRCNLGFDYLGTEDPSRMTVEDLPPKAPLTRVQRVILEVNTVPYVLKLFSAKNPPKEGHTALYYCPAPNAFQKPKMSRPA